MTMTEDYGGDKERFDTQDFAGSEGLTERAARALHKWTCPFDPVCSHHSTTDYEAAKAALGVVWPEVYAAIAKHRSPYILTDEHQQTWNAALDAVEAELRKLSGDTSA